MSTKTTFLRPLDRPPRRARVWAALGILAAWLMVSASAQSPLKLEETPAEPACNGYVLQHTLSANLTVKQRACLYGQDFISGNGVFGASFFAGIGQFQNTPKEWRQGAAGYIRRFASNMGQSTAKSTGQFVASYFLHEDPRIQPLAYAGASQEPLRTRFLKGLVAPVVIWGETRRPRFGYVAGSFASGFAGMAWYPQSQLHLKDAFSRTGTAFGGYVLSSVYKAIQPDLYSWLSKLVGNKPDPPPQKNSQAAPMAQ